MAREMAYLCEFCVDGELIMQLRIVLVMAAEGACNSHKVSILYGILSGRSGSSLIHQLRTLVVMLVEAVCWTRPKQKCTCDLDNFQGLSV